MLSLPIKVFLLKFEFRGCYIATFRSDRQYRIVARYRRNFSTAIRKRDLSALVFPRWNHRTPFSRSYIPPFDKANARVRSHAHKSMETSIVEPHRQKRPLTNSIKIMHFRAFANERCHFISTWTSHVVRPLPTSPAADNNYGYWEWLSLWRPVY